MSRFVFSYCRRLPHEPVVQSGLSVTPAQMSELALSGVPVSSHNLQSFYDDGYSAFDMTIPVDKTRGVDIADMWNARQDSKRKLRDLKSKFNSKDVS